MHVFMFLFCKEDIGPDDVVCTESPVLHWDIGTGKPLTQLQGLHEYSLAFCIGRSGCVLDFLHIANIKWHELCINPVTRSLLLCDV